MGTECPALNWTQMISLGRWQGGGFRFSYLMCPLCLHNPVKCSKMIAPLLILPHQPSRSSTGLGLPGFGVYIKPFQ